jgi:hypothetical protein
MRFILLHKTGTAVLAVVLCVAGYLGWRHSASMRGKLAAHYDIRRGRYVVLGIGAVPTPYPYISELMLARYAIEFRWVRVCVDDCAADRPLVEYVEAYNKTSIAAANKKYRQDVFQQTIPDAITNFNRARGRSRSAPQ